MFKHLMSPVLLCLLLLINGCSGAPYHKAQVASTEGDALTVGKVQREIRVGMSGGDVAAVLGSPNIVSTDENRREVWIYDKIATTSAYSTDSGGVSALILGGGILGSSGALGGAGSGNYQSGSGATETTQKTLTVIIKFGDDKRVRDFAYHTSRF